MALYKSTASSRGGRIRRRESSSCGSQVCWTGARSSLWSSPTRSSGGIFRAGGSSGGGSRGQDGHRFRGTCNDSSVRIAQENPTWGEERIAHELRLKLGLTVSPRTVGRYLRTLGPRRGRGQRSQRWATFVRNHAHAVLAGDFFTNGDRPVPHPLCLRRPRCRHASDPPLERDRASHGGVDDPAVSRVIAPKTSHRFVLHDRDSIYVATVDRAIASMGRHVLRTPVRKPQANAFCERLIGTMRRECLDWLIPAPDEEHFRSSFSGDSTARAES